MRYSELHSQAPLNTFIECFWSLESDNDIVSPQPERILPDGCVELILNFGSPFTQHNDDVQQSVQPQNFIVGQMTQPILISPTGLVELIGIRFHPGGTVPFFRLPMHELTNRVVELGSVARALEAKLKAATEGCHRLADKIADLEHLLMNLLLESKTDFRLLRIASKIVERAGSLSIDDLADGSGLSNRQLERRFLNDVGLGPKLLSRILRFQQVFRAVEANRMSWPEVAIDCGYYDQAHLIKDFRQFANQTPSILFAQQSRLSESFTRKNRVSNFSNTRLG